MNSGTKRNSIDMSSSSGSKTGTNSRSPMKQPQHNNHHHRQHVHSPTKKRREEPSTSRNNNGIANSGGGSSSSSKSPWHGHSGGLGAALEEMRDRKWAAIASTSSSAAKVPSSSERRPATNHNYHRHHQQQKRPHQKQQQQAKGGGGGAQRRLTFSNNHNTSRKDDDDEEEDDDEDEDGEDDVSVEGRQRHHHGAEPSADGADTLSSSCSYRMRTLPLSKVRTIMESSPNVSELKLSGEAMFAMGKAAEAFISLLAKGAHQQMLTGNHTRINYNELAIFVHDSDELNFIQDILPRKHKFSEVEKMIEANRR